MDKIEDRATGCGRKEMLEDMEHSKMISMQQISDFCSEFKDSMAKAEEQLLDYSRALSGRSKMP
eukprot:11977386-Karenia_brevis.AAC.1